MYNYHDRYERNGLLVQWIKMLVLQLNGRGFKSTVFEPQFHYIEFTFYLILIKLLMTIQLGVKECQNVTNKTFNSYFLHG